MEPTQQPQQQAQQAQQTQQQEQTFQFPTEEVTLPSKGLLYPEGHPLKSGIVQMKYMTAREEDILTNQNFIKNGTVIDKVLESLLISKINLDDMLIGDKNSLLVAARILGYGSEYTFKYPHPDTKESEEITVDLTDASDKYFDNSKMINGKNEFEFVLPMSKVVLTFKLLTQGDDKKIDAELKGLKKINRNSEPQLTTRLKHMILSVNGDYTVKTVREFVDNQFLARDSKPFRDYASSIMPDIDLDFNINFEDGASVDGVSIPININFFWPDASV
tara:strand:- start:280 stop:1104 length:825 start_codon:yes stop_codon:yes gene_type:complete